MPAHNERFGVRRGVCSLTLCRILEVCLPSEPLWNPAQTPSRHHVVRQRVTRQRRHFRWNLTWRNLTILLNFRRNLVSLTLTICKNRKSLFIFVSTNTKCEIVLWHIENTLLKWKSCFSRLTSVEIQNKCVSSSRNIFWNIRMWVQFPYTLQNIRQTLTFVHFDNFVIFLFDFVQLYSLHKKRVKFDFV
jgi:hypothetical protein